MHRGVIPSSTAFSLDITTSAAAASLIPEELAAVTIPSFLNAGLSLAIPSAVTPCFGYSSVSNTIGSPFLCGISTGTISSLNLPAAIAAQAFC